MGEYKERLYYDTGLEEYITEEQLRDEFEILQEENPDDYADLTFNQFINNCLLQSGGTLEEVGF